MGSVDRNPARVDPLSSAVLQPLSLVASIPRPPSRAALPATNHHRLAAAPTATGRLTLQHMMAAATIPAGEICGSQHHTRVVLQHPPQARSGSLHQAHSIAAPPPATPGSQHHARCIAALPAGRSGSQQQARCIAAPPPARSGSQQQARCNRALLVARSIGRSIVCVAWKHPAAGEIHGCSRGFLSDAALLRREAGGRERKVLAAVAAAVVTCLKQPLVPCSRAWRAVAPTVVVAGDERTARERER